AVIRGLLLAAEHHYYASLRIEFNDHVRTLVGNPDVVLAIDFDRVRVRPRVEVVADLAHELAVRAKLEKLRSTRPIGRPRRIATRENKDVSLGIDCHACHFPKIQIGGKFQKVRNRTVTNYRPRGRLSKKRSGHKKQKKKGPSHRSLRQAKACASQYNLQIPTAQQGDNGLASEYWKAWPHQSGGVTSGLPVIIQNTGNCSGKEKSFVIRLRYSQPQ